MSAEAGYPAPDDVDPLDVPVIRRRERLAEDLDTGRGRGLEIGPLFSPLVLKDAAQVEYVDVHGVDGLREYYRDHPGVPGDRIVDVDHVLYHEGRLRTVRAATSASGRYDWVVASHVVEHVPDMVAWLRDLADTLRDHGRLALVVPDRRYTFDAARVPTTVGELLDAHERQDQRPSLRAVYDYFSEAVEVSAHDSWRGADPHRRPRTFGTDEVAAAVRRFRTTTDYIDCHAWVWTPQEFVAQLAALFAMGLLDFTVERVRPTPVSDLEFSVVLRRLPRDLPAADREGLAVTGFAIPADLVLDEPVPAPEPAAVPHDAVGEVGDVLSDRERALIRRKRHLLGVARRAVGRFRER